MAKFTLTPEQMMKGCDEIEKAISVYYEDKKDRNRMLGILLSIKKQAESGTRILAAAVPVDQIGKGADGKPVRVRGFRLNTLKGTNDKLFAAMFTSPAEVNKGREQNINSPTVLMPIQDFLTIVSKRPEISGIMINAFGEHRLYLSQQAAQAILKDEQADKDPEIQAKRKAAAEEAMKQARAAAIRKVVETQAKHRGPEIAESTVFGAVIGDALGVPVEFSTREDRAADPVTDLRGDGTHNKPAGTWSDDSSLLLASLCSLAEGTQLDFTDVMDRFFAWRMRGAYTADDGEAFGVGNTCDAAIMAYAANKPALQCGLTEEDSCGNGSLMRIAPFALLLLRRGHTFDEADRYMIHQASSLTHAHPRCKLACEIYAVTLRSAILSMGLKKKEAVLQEAMNDLDLFYRGPRAIADSADETEEEKKLDEEAMENHRSFVKDYDEVRGEFSTFSRLGDIEAFKALPEEDIRSTGYVVDTLEAALWCFLNTDNYKDCVLKAVNLGGDTDTIACVAGGLAGAYYGKENIPQEWVDGVAKSGWIREKAAEFQHKWLG